MGAMDTEIPSACCFMSSSSATSRSIERNSCGESGREIVLKKVTLLAQTVGQDRDGIQRILETPLPVALESRELLSDTARRCALADQLLL